MKILSLFDGIRYNVNMASIYIIKSKTSGKCYVGQTNSTAEKRWTKHLVELRRRDGCSALYSAIKKYGVQDFEVKTIKQGFFDKKQLNELEKNYIFELKTLSPNGYNLQTGGGSFNLSQDVKDKISKANKGREIVWHKKISKGVKKLWEDPVYREKQTKQRHEKRGKYRLGIKKPLRLKLNNNKIQEMYKQGLTINKIAQKLNVSFGVIKRRI